MKKIQLLFSALILSVSSVLALLAPVVAHATPNTCTWTGSSSNNFNTAANWSSCGSTVPQTGDSLIFDATSLSAATTLTNNITGLSVASITFQGTNSSSYSFTISGNALTVSTAINVTSATYPTISANIALGGNVALNVSNANAYMTLTGVISSTGNLTTTGSVYLEGANTFTGSITVSSGLLASTLANSLGNSSNALTVNNGGNVSFGSCSDDGFTIPYDMSLTGASSSPSGASPVSKFSDGALCQGGGAGSVPDESYEQAGTSSQAYTFSGHITLGSDVTFGGIAKQTTLTGALSGAFKISLPNNYGGQLIVNSSNNTSSTPNATYNPDAITATLSDNVPSHTVEIGTNAIVTIDGVRGDINLLSGGTLKGTGTIGTLAATSGSTVAPGHSPGCLSTGNLTLFGTYQAELGGTTPCTGYDQLKVTGTVNVTNGTLQTTLYNGFKPAAGQTYVIISNDGSDAVTGAFTGLAEGATFNVSGNVFEVSYKGGDGNDIVLTVVSVPAAPNTGFTLIKNNPLIAATGMFAAAGGIALIARRTKFAARRR